MRLAALLLLASCGFAQNYVVTKQTSLSGAAEVITVQQPATGSRQVSFKSAFVDCSVACTVTLERNGTAATATTLAVRNVNPGELAASAVAFSSSNVGTGTVLGTASLVAGGAVIFDLTGINFAQGSVANNNLTIRTSSITGTVDISISFTGKTL